MDLAPKTLDHEATKPKPLLPLSFANGVPKKHQQRPPPLPPPVAVATLAVQHPTSPSNQDQQRFVYRECLKNHAAALGGHALDGCGEFMPSPNSNPSDPTSLTCAACGCHRNFHRRIQGGFLKHQHQHHRDNEERDEDDEEQEEEEGEDHSSPNQYYSAPHMLLALSGGLAGGMTGAVGADPSRLIATPTTGGSAAGALATGSATVLPRKRFRSRFSPDQKEKMHELSERLGWRMQKRDEGLVEECCKEIGVGKGVFKVWMHNNKHNFCGSNSSRRGEAATGGGGINTEVVEGIGEGRNEKDNIAIGNGNGSNNGNSSQVVNGASSS